MTAEGNRRWLAVLLWEHQRYIRYFNVIPDKFEVAVLRSRASKLCGLDPAQLTATILSSLSRMLAATPGIIDLFQFERNVQNSKPLVP